MSPKDAWKPLPKSKWDRAAARHLASRLGYSVHPKTVDAIYETGPDSYLEKTLGELNPMPNLEVIDQMFAVEMQVLEDRRNKVYTDPKRQKEIRQQSREAYSDYALAWYAFARDPVNSPQEKLVSFFQNVWVVAFQGVRSVPYLFDYQKLIRSHLTKSYPEMCKALSKSQAMFSYLDLRRNKKDAPNENFARELLELFTLGEGNYTETDIKEAARALTGYGFRPDNSFVLRERQHDASKKTIFGKEGNFEMESLIDLIFEQDAAARFLPSEFLAFYLSDKPFAPEALEALAELWRDSGYDLPTLYRTVFTSRIFYDLQFRGTLIKSPEHFYLGLLQDLELDLSPLARDVFRPLRTMGQAFLNPPNVRGWPGGRNWINTATLASRRQIAEVSLLGFANRNLNADEKRQIEEAEAAGQAQFSIDAKAWRSELDPKRSAFHAIAARLFADPESSVTIDAMREKRPVSELNKKEFLELLYLALNAPEYQLC